MPDRGRNIEGVEPRSGATADGRPLSLNRAPAPDLDPWVSRVGVSRVELPDGFEIACSVFNDISYARVAIEGDWILDTPAGPAPMGPGPMLVGPQSRAMGLLVRGSFLVINIGLRPGALHCLLGRSATPLVDRMERDDPFGLAEGEYPPDAGIEELALLAEERMRAFIRRTNPKHPAHVSRAFEAASFLDPTISPGDFAARQGLSLRQVERIARRDFGLTPRTVLRRARAMDLACHMLGISDRREEQEFLLRFFDQSHLIREFQHFFGVTPAAFRARPRILLTLNLEARAARRLEELARIAPGALRPWHDGWLEGEEAAEEEEE